MVTTITVSTDTLARFNDLKAETGDGEAIAELSSDQFLNSLLDAWEENGESIYGEVDIQHLINDIAATADESGRVDSDELARQVVSQLDYAELANSVADEIEVRMK